MGSAGCGAFPSYHPRGGAAVRSLVITPSYHPMGSVGCLTLTPTLSLAPTLILALTLTLTKARLAASLRSARAAVDHALGVLLCYYVRARAALSYAYYSYAHYGNAYYEP